MSKNPILVECEERFDKSVSHLKHQLVSIRTGRASAALVENIRVDYYGTMTPISQLGSISIPEPRQIMIKPFDAGILKEIGRAVAKADLGAAPQDDGKLLRIELPALSGDQRKKYAAKVKELCEEARVALRNGRRDSNKAADAEKKEGNLTEDENHKLHDDIQALLKDYEKRVDDILAAKSKEVLED
ncbi:MAG: ribosome recycling factor [Planctomycetota bacterium]|nr:ribosome recycling factor [Planctomycetota bacterium]